MLFCSYDVIFIYFTGMIVLLCFFRLLWFSEGYGYCGAQWRHHRYVWNVICTFALSFQNLIICCFCFLIPEKLFCFSWNVYDRDEVRQNGADNRKRKQKIDLHCGSLHWVKRTSSNRWKIPFLSFVIVRSNPIGFSIGPCKVGQNKPI